MDWVERAREATERGEFLLAVDLADRGLAEHPENLRLQQMAVLALARAGATDTAAQRFLGGPLARSDDPDVQALGARLAKDLALRAEGPARGQRARRAARRYAEIGGSYPLVNAATLSVVAGEDEAAREHAERALAALAHEPSSPWTEVTRAEALITLGRTDEAHEALRKGQEVRLDPSAAASAFRQLALLCELRGVDSELLAPLRGPSLVHFCGHVIGERFSDEDEEAVRAAIARALDAQPVAGGYGSLAAGGDLLVAEALLERGAQLHVVLPCGAEDFVAASVRPSGERWVSRFARCLDAASEVTVVTPSAQYLDDGLLTFGSELAMGLALLRARWLHADAWQLAVWDGATPTAPSGTAADVVTWRRRGGRTVAIKPPNGGSVARRPVRPPDSGRRTVAFLFGDIAGYSKLPDETLPRTTELLMDVVAGILAEHEEHVVTSNTWGDAVLIAVRGPEPAARIALDLQEGISGLEPVETGLLSPFAFRLAAHIGPVFVVPNALRGRPDVVGEHVNRTARLEPVTPPGEVYVTDAFAATLELAAVSDLCCDYVGHLPGAKDIGRLRMHRLRRR